MVNFKKFKEQDYSSIKSDLAKTGPNTLFEDPEFPAEDSSLYFSKQPTFKAEWKRPKDISAEAALFVEGASSRDVTQGRVGNCWFVSAAASLTLENDLWQKVIPDYKTPFFDPENYNGIIRFHFWRFGEWIEIVVDDRLPTINGELIYVKSKDKNEFWSALLEKAYAKMAGSYEALEGGNPADALVDFTGGVSETIDLVKGDYANKLEKRKILHQDLSKLMERKSLSSASIKIKNNTEMEQQLDTGLVKGHAYGITAVKKIALGEGFFSKFNAEKLFLVRLRNPWGSKEWNGAWSDGSKEWEQLNANERESLDIKIEDDGEFWMSFDDFCTHFTNITICVLVNTSLMTWQKTYNEGMFKNKWEGKSAGGCVNNKETFLHNPQYSFDMSGKEKDVAFISLMQPDIRNLKSVGKGNLTFGFLVAKVEGNRLYRIHQMYEKSADSPFINAREIMIRADLEPGRYVVIPSTFDANLEGDFLLRVYTDDTNRMKELTLSAPEVSCLSCITKYPTIQMSVVVTDIKGLEKKGVSLTVDAYCIIECEGTKVKTPIRSNNLNPEINYGGLFYVKNPQTAMLKIQVYDHNALVMDTFLGEMERDIKVTNSTLLFTSQLMGKKGRDGQAVQTAGKISYKLAVSDDIEFM